MDIPARLSRAGIIPVAAIESAENAVPAAEALLAGGIDVMEITHPQLPDPRAPRCRAAGGEYPLLQI